MSVQNKLLIHRVRTAAESNTASTVSALSIHRPTRRTAGLYHRVPPNAANYAARSNVSSSCAKASSASVTLRALGLPGGRSRFLRG